MSSAVTRPKPAEPARAIKHFEALLEFETDCWDVHHAVSNQRQDFVLIDVRSEALFLAGHLPNAINIPRHKLNDQTLKDYGIDEVMVVYCAGPHCNGADKAALALADMGRPVKKMIGGVTGWLDEGFSLVLE
ncbi:MAG: rhodanese-like domain-containing protein [Pseudomonadota bacterium]